MTDPNTSDRDSAEVLRPLRRVRQVRQFTQDPVDDATLDAVVDVGRWSGSSRNSQPWRFIVIRDTAIVRQVADLDLPHTRALTTAAAAIAVVLPRAPESSASHAYDEGRAAERMLIAATLLGLGAGVAWISPGNRDAVGEVLGVPADRMVRSVLAIGHPSKEAKRPKSATGEARLPRSETVSRDRWEWESAVD